MSNIDTYSFEDISKEFSHYFQIGSLTSSYKPVLLNAILFNIKSQKFIREHTTHFIPLDNIASYFLKFYFTLYRRFHLNQLHSKKNKIAIHRIIDKEYTDHEITKLKDSDITPKILTKVKSTLLRNVIYLLRKDSYFYEFYDVDFNIIKMKRNVKDEQNFNQILRNQEKSKHDINYIGIPDTIILFIDINRPILHAAVNASLARFMEKVNTTPNLNIKILAADGSFNEMRNISDVLKEKLYQYQKNICFYCGVDMGHTPEADHFVPYNYLFDSPIWNILGACEKCNSRKSNHLVQEKHLKKIQDRNLDEKFRLEFFQDRENTMEYAQNLNDILEQHYRNCLNYFRKIEI